MYNRNNYTLLYNIMSSLYIPFKNKYSFEERLTESCRIKKENSETGEAQEGFG